MEVSRSSFYDYLHSIKRSEDPDETALKARIGAIFKEHRSKYGSRRITRQLRDEGHQIGRYKARRFMRQLNLKAKAPKRYKVTTDSRHSFPVAANLLNREFNVDKPNTCWTADITYIWTYEGWLYLAVVLDLYSRQVVGWAMNKLMETQLCHGCPGNGILAQKTSIGACFIIRIEEVSMHAMITENGWKSIWHGSQHEPQRQLLGQCTDRTIFS